MDTRQTSASAAAAAASATQTPAQLAKAALRRLAMGRQEPTPRNFAKAWREEGGEPDPLSANARHALMALAARVMPDGTPAQREQLIVALAEQRFEAVEALLPAASPSSAQGNGHGSAAGASAASVATAAAAAGGPSGAQWADVIDRVVKLVDRGTRQWTAGRKKDSLQRVLTNNRSDASKLQQRLKQLITNWETDVPDDAAGEAQQGGGPERGLTQPAPLDGLPPAASAAPAAAAPAAAGDAPTSIWPSLMTELEATVQAALPPTDPRASEVALRINELAGSFPGGQALEPSLVDELKDACEQARRVLQHRHHLVTQLGTLVGALTDSLSELSEDDTWVQGQCEAMRNEVERGLSARGVRSVGEMLRSTRERQRELKIERIHARDALKKLIHQMLQDIGELGEHTGKFSESVGRYAEVIGSANSLESLAGVVREMVEETRTVHELVSQTQKRLHDEHAAATEMAAKVRALEDEIRRLSDEVSTDQLTQIANRRGLIASFEIESSRALRDGAPLAIGLLDIDNFKKLNDTLGHQTGDEALKFMANRVKEALRPGDIVARYGGEEFVVLLPGTPVDEAQATVTRLQRALSAELFMYEGKQTFVTFSAGVTVHRSGETIEAALERADVALYEAKRTGKNRTCVA